MPADPAHNSGRSEAIAAAAAQWLARRDRGLTAADQDEYLQWLSSDPRHGETLARLEKTWGILDGLAEWRPEHSAQPNPDLLARPRWARRIVFASVLAGLAAAAAVAFVLVPRATEPTSAPANVVHVIPQPERLALSDGSVVELNHGGKIETDFTPGERRVRLVRGEAHFTVAKNPLRPFIVEAGSVAVRAVGTAFDVRRDTAAVAVLVTEGKVQVERHAAPAAPAVATPLVAGERVVVETTAPRAPVVTTLSSAEIERALVWQGVRLEFENLPLSEVVAEFNIRNSAQIAVADPETGALRVGGSFRADNVDGFVRLLAVSFGVKSERRDDGVLLLRRSRP